MKIMDLVPCVISNVHLSLAKQSHLLNKAIALLLSKMTYSKLL